MKKIWRRCLSSRQTNDIDLHRITTLVSALTFKKATSADDLQLRLEHWFNSFPPTETYMAQLSILHDKYYNTFGYEEYCITTVMSAAVYHICKVANQGHVQRVSSFPRVKKKHVCNRMKSAPT